MHSPYTSDVFWHMIGYGILRDASIAPEDKSEHCYQRLKQVLASSYIAARAYNGELLLREGDVQYSIDSTGHLRNGDFNGFLVKGCITCYADIPFSSLGLHTTKYGQFGFGVSSAYLSFVGARPVTYIPCHRGLISTSHRGSGLLDNMTNEIKKLYNVVEDYENLHNPENSEGERIVSVEHENSQLMHMLLGDVAAYIKPYDANLSTDHPECYYTEREWRLVGSVQIVPQKVPVIVVAKGYRERLLQEVPAALQFEIRELGS
ncbi:abortive infection system antitoxin AbiGi family protein [Pseudomonas sp. QL9]|uniref:abortive infection system antitoxin AbiGi family protein n=1 Tax=Pseudomonas sp. QL9 TaxID=3242725 RepID=UPI003529E389